MPDSIRLPAVCRSYEEDADMDARTCERRWYFFVSAAPAEMDWQGGALKWVAGGCVLGMRFEPDRQAPPSAFQKIAGQDLSSNNPDAGALKLRVVEIFVNSPR